METLRNLLLCCFYVICGVCAAGGVWGRGGSGGSWDGSKSTGVKYKSLYARRISAVRVEGLQQRGGVAAIIGFLLGAQTTTLQLSIICLHVCAYYVFKYLLMGYILVDRSSSLFAGCGRLYSYCVN